jgi:shikimate 5-dehydrogenase
MKFGLIGHPIEHSLSPALFKAGYDGKYTYNLIETPDFEEAYSIFLKEYDGINVTAPFKELALQRADIVSEECMLIGAANILIKTPQGIAAYNSDFRGLQEMLWEISRLASLARNDKRPRTLVLGIGGAGKAAKAAAEALGYETTVINRTQYAPDIKPLRAFREEFLKADIIIYNLPVRIEEIDGLTQEDIKACGKKIIIEANYRNPSFDKDLKAKWMSVNPEIEYVDGKTWLLAQAVTGYELFTGEMPNREAMSKKLL